MTSQLQQTLVLYDMVERIEHHKLKKAIGWSLLSAPPHFWTDPSSRGHHHEDERNEGGLVLHTLRVATMAQHILDCQNGSYNRDIVLAAALLHDIAKFGLGEEPSPKTLPNHPELAAYFFRERWFDLGFKGCDEESEVEECIRCHMGQWGVKMPSTPESWLVHTADYLATNYQPSLSQPTGVNPELPPESLSKASQQIVKK